MLRTAACGFGSLALSGLCAAATDERRRAGSSNYQPVLAPRAKRIIFVFMQGGPSHVDTFDPKPRLTADDGKQMEFHVARTRKVSAERLLKSPWRFAQHGESGRWVSELLPEISRHVDDLCVIRSMHTEGVAHGPATLFLHTGATNLIRPSVGAWVTYGLGSENQNLPGFVTISPPSNMGGPRNYANAFLPAVFQGTAIGRPGAPIEQAKIRHISNSRLSLDEQKRQLALLQDLNREQLQRTGGSDELQATIESFELAFRMQMNAPEVMDLSKESKQTFDLYGIGTKETDAFGRQCLLARRLAEAGVRYVQINYSENDSNPRWDQHSNLKQHEEHARATDKPVAALLADLKQRGLLEDTLVWWGGEFGRTPFAQGRDGRDHNPGGFTVWLAGGGVKAGIAHGETDEFGHAALVDRVHMHDLHATLLHLLGLDHERLTFRYSGRDFRLTDVKGRVVDGILA
jgi:hypothetical protein